MSFVCLSVSISLYVSIGAVHVKAYVCALGSGVDWRARELRVISLPRSPRGDSADRTLPGSQLQPLITPSARPSPLWSLTLGEEISRGRQRCVCGKGRGWSSQGMLGCGKAGRVGWKREEEVKRDLGRRGRGWKVKEERRGENSREVSSQYNHFFNPKSSCWRGKMDTHYRQTLCQHHGWQVYLVRLHI